MTGGQMYEIAYRNKTYRVAGFKNTIRAATSLWIDARAWREKTGDHALPTVREI